MISNEITDFTKKVLIVVGIVVLAILLVLGVIYVFDVILLLFGAILLAIFLRGLADLLNRYTKLSDGTAVLLVSLLLVLILAGAISLLAPSVAEQVRHLRDELPKSAKQAGAYISQFGWGRTLIDQLPSADEIMQKVGAATFFNERRRLFFFDARCARQFSRDDSAGDLSGKRAAFLCRRFYETFPG